LPNPNRFQDENKILSHFYCEVLVACPGCHNKASAKLDIDEKKARLVCLHCGYNKEKTTTIKPGGTIEMPAHQFFDAQLWLQAPFKNEIFWAYNMEHLSYLQKYIAASLREHKDRTRFTLLEKLPKFYHDAKNREDLLKVIDKLQKNNC
jgi:hypothetical protein